MNIADSHSRKLRQAVQLAFQADAEVVRVFREGGGHVSYTIDDYGNVDALVEQIEDDLAPGRALVRLVGLDVVGEWVCEEEL